jgi:ribose 5-phosphate isomerase A
MTDDPLAHAKEVAGRYAAGLIEDGMTVGLGTGSTVFWTITALGERHADVVCTVTSHRTEALARSLRLVVVPPDELGRLDIAVDGADEIDPDLNLIKGGGGAHTREKIVADMADRFVVVADQTKLVEELGAFGVPIEALDFAPGVLAARLRDLGAHEVVRSPERSDNGNLLMRAWFGPLTDPEGLAAALAALPGLVEHGIFPHEMVTRVVVSDNQGHVVERLRSADAC